ncbi:hypothetical protein [Sneathiella glossodoripedis]|uniref:hypothetical protein n=1 Tax=Sneathiella glossodoripedis TaxID=418853 RepID=UPI000566FA58|nr:hypothetical protein [Sneathiella glossodoripedis]
MDEDWKQEVIEATETENMNASDVEKIQAALDLDKNWQPINTKRKSLGSNGFPHLSTFVDQRGYIIKTKPERFTPLAISRHGS